jgi:hypothetical protein
MSKLITCTPKSLPSHKMVEAAVHAVEENPANHAPVARLLATMPGFVPTKEHIALLTTKYWGAAGVRLTVSFLDNPPPALRSRILGHMNAWSRDANIVFVETDGLGEVRIARSEGDGYWSYVGTDIKSIAANEPTMNLDSFSMNTLDSEFYRVVRHETAHTLGFIHEHMRRALVDRIDVDKAIKYFRETQNWSEAEVRAQVLTPIEESSLRGTTPDPDSIMCYQIPGEITKDGESIDGGVDIDALDYTLAAKLYPKSASASRHSHPSGDPPLIFLASTDPAYVGAVIAAIRGRG